MQRVAGRDARQDADAVDGLGRFADQVVACHQCHVAALDLALIEQVVTRFQPHAASTTDAALVEQIAGSDANIGTGDDALVAHGVGGVELDVAACDQGAIAAQLKRVGGQVDHRHQYLLALVVLLHHPHDVLGERSGLRGGEADAHAQLQLACGGHAGFQQSAVLRHTISVVAQVATTGELSNLVQHQALLVEAVAQAGLGPLRIHAQLV
ncbi:hypothetical protein [Xanthomonas vesicatoria]|uniref:hypothetical protein n=1 Tax=Xanthomonas vesicatoria TaxID=56460 RepID=UPI003557B006